MEEVLNREEIDEKEDEGVVEQTGFWTLLTAGFRRMFGSDEPDHEEMLEKESPELVQPLMAEETIQLGDEEPEEVKETDPEKPRDAFIRGLNGSNNSGGGGGLAGKAGHGNMQPSISDGQEQNIKE